MRNIFLLIEKKHVEVSFAFLVIFFLSNVHLGYGYMLKEGCSPREICKMVNEGMMDSNILHKCGAHTGAMEFLSQKGRGRCAQLANDDKRIGAIVSGLKTKKLTSKQIDQLTKEYDCSGCDLSGRNLRGLSLVDVDLTEANLTGADLVGVDLSGADLTGANLTGADLTETNLTGAVLTEADLAKANLSGTIIEDVEMPEKERKLIEQRILILTAKYKQQHLDEENRVAEQQRIKEEKRLAEKSRQLEEERKLLEDKRKLLEDERKQAEALRLIGWPSSNLLDDAICSKKFPKEKNMITVKGFYIGMNICDAQWIMTEGKYKEFFPNTKIFYDQRDVKSTYPFCLQSHVEATAPHIIASYTMGDPKSTKGNPVRARTCGSEPGMVPTALVASDNKDGKVTHIEFFEKTIEGLFKSKGWSHWNTVEYFQTVYNLKERGYPAGIWTGKSLSHVCHDCTRLHLYYSYNIKEKIGYKVIIQKTDDDPPPASSTVRGEFDPKSGRGVLPSVEASIKQKKQRELTDRTYSIKIELVKSKSRGRCDDESKLNYKEISMCRFSGDDFFLE
jgi:uncharacterized protein YjbI with pentapeptide repeats